MKTNKSAYLAHVSSSLRCGWPHPNAFALQSTPLLLGVVLRLPPGALVAREWIGVFLCLSLEMVVLREAAFELVLGCSSSVPPTLWARAA